MALSGKQLNAVRRRELRKQAVEASFSETRSATQPQPVSVKFKRATHVRHFADAAGQGRLTESWSSSPVTVDTYIYQHWSTLVARSRDQAEKSDHARKFIQLCKDNIAGPEGFSLQSQVKDASGGADALACDAVENAWYDFSEKGTFDVTRSMSRADFERLLVSTIATDGEAIAIKRFSSDFRHGMALQMVDPVTLDPTHFEELRNGNKIKHGIEFNALEQPVAYWFKQFEEKQIGYIIGGKQNRLRVSAENVIHIFIVEKVGQKRGLPWMRTPLMRLRNLAAFEDAEIINARVGAAKMGFFKDGENADNGDPERELPMDAEPGVFENIGDREFIGWNPTFPDVSSEAFKRSNLRSVAVGLGVGYNNLASDLTSVNFSSLRQGALDEREVWKALQAFFINSWCKLIFPEWLESSLLMERVTVPRKGGGNAALSWTKLDKFKPCLFSGRRWDWIDPVKDVEANTLAIQQGLKSRSRVIRDMGHDPEDVWQEIQRENETLKRMGIEIATPAGTKQPTAQDEE